MAKVGRRTPAQGPMSIEEIGGMHVLAVGVSKQMKSSGFRALPQSENNALAIRDCFADTPQLYSQPGAVHALTSKGGVVSKGTIINAVQELASNAGPNDRLLFFWSGHGQRLDEKLYFVPEDAWASAKAEALLDFDLILDLIESSEAKQKIVVLDACWTGLDAIACRRSFQEYLARKPGIAVVASTQTEPTLSPDRKLNLFTYHVRAALGGAGEALENHLLTLPKLFEYVLQKLARDSSHEPVLKPTSSGSMILGDFLPVLTPSSLAMDQSPIDSVLFTDTEPVRVKDLLSNYKKNAFSPEYLQSAVNKTLRKRFEEELGQVVAAIKNRFDVPENDVEVEEAGVTFPGGRYWYSFEVDDDKSGRILKSLTVSETWLEDGAQVVALLKLLDMQPTEIALELSGTIDLKQILAGMRASGWTLRSQLPDRIEFAQNTFALTLEPNRVSFRGFLASELLGKSETSQSKLAGGVMKLLGAK